MMTKGEMRIRPEETGPINWILFYPWLAMRWDWETCGGSLILPSKMVEVRALAGWFDLVTQERKKLIKKVKFWSEFVSFYVLSYKKFISNLTANC